MAGSVERRFQFRSPRLYDGILRILLEPEFVDGARWNVILGRADPKDEWAERSVEGAIRDLQVLGAVFVSSGSRSGPGRGARVGDRRVFVTPLGRAACAGSIAVLPWESELG